MDILELTIDHYPALLKLMEQTPGIILREADSIDATSRYLKRNPGLSFIAMVDGAIVGCAMAGHDGRRGYLQHVFTIPSHRNRGIAQRLVARCLDALGAQGIDKIHLDVLASNHPALGYWQRRGWTMREDIVRFSFAKSGNANA